MRRRRSFRRSRRGGYGRRRMRSSRRGRVLRIGYRM